MNCDFKGVDLLMGNKADKYRKKDFEGNSQWVISSRCSVLFFLLKTVLFFMIKRNVTYVNLRWHSCVLQKSMTFKYDKNIIQQSVSVSAITTVVLYCCLIRKQRYGL